MEEQKSQPREEQTKPLPKLTDKQQVFVSEVVKTGKPAEAALKAFDTTDPHSARSIAHEYLQKPAIIQAITEKRKTLRQAMIDNGITEDKIAKKVDMLLEAKDRDGNPDYAAIDKGIKHAATFHGVEDPESRPPVVRNTYNFLFSDEARGKIREVEAVIRDALTKKKNNAQET